MKKSKHILKTGMFGLCLFLVFGKPLKSQEDDSVSFISLKPAEFLEEIKNVNNYLIVDVREPFELSGGMLKDAVSIPALGNLDRAADTIDKSKNLFLYCTSGFRSSKAAKKLAEKGFIHVYSLEGGIIAWKNEGYAVEKRKIKRRDQKRAKF
jgi:rhodanese-related sulfurtransferase